MEMVDQYAGNLGRRAYSLDLDYNKLVDQANRLVEDYNAKVGGIEMAQRMSFQKETINEIEDLLSRRCSRCRCREGS